MTHRVRAHTCFNPLRFPAPQPGCGCRWLKPERAARLVGKRRAVWLKAGAIAYLPNGKPKIGRVRTIGCFEIEALAGLRGQQARYRQGKRIAAYREEGISRDVVAKIEKLRSRSFPNDAAGGVGCSPGSPKFFWGKP